MRFGDWRLKDHIAVSGKSAIDDRTLFVLMIFYWEYLDAFCTNLLEYNDRETNIEAIVKNFVIFLRGLIPIM